MQDPAGAGKAHSAMASLLVVRIWLLPSGCRPSFACVTTVWHDVHHHMPLLSA